MRLAGTEYFKMLGEVNKFSKQRGQPALSDALLGGNESDPGKGNDAGSPRVEVPGSNSSQTAAHQHHHVHPSSDKPCATEQGQHDSSGTAPAQSLHIRRGGLLDEIA